jgi:hypothetical protein
MVFMPALQTTDSNSGNVYKMQQTAFIPQMGCSNASVPRSDILLTYEFMPVREFRTCGILCVASKSTHQLNIPHFRDVGIFMLLNFYSHNFLQKYFLTDVHWPLWQTDVLKCPYHLWHNLGTPCISSSRLIELVCQSVSSEKWRATSDKTFDYFLNILSCCFFLFLHRWCTVSMSTGVSVTAFVNATLACLNVGI